MDPDNEASLTVGKHVDKIRLENAVALLSAIRGHDSECGQQDNEPLNTEPTGDPEIHIPGNDGIPHLTTKEESLSDTINQANMADSPEPEIPTDTISVTWLFKNKISEKKKSTFQLFKQSPDSD